MKDLTIFHVCCQKGETKNSLAKKTIQFTDSSVLHCITGTDAARNVHVNDNDNTVAHDISDRITSRKSKNKIIFHIVRDAIWLTGCWKKSGVLDSFIKENKIDLIYLPVYASCYMCNVQLEIINKVSVPVVAHISDDVYREHGRMFRGLAGHYYQRCLQKKIRKIIAKCLYIDVFSENMKTDYERLFQRKCYVIGKGVRAEDIPPENYKSTNNNIILYTGGLGNGRFKVIAYLAKWLDDYSRSYEIYIYSQDPIEGEIKEALKNYNCIRFMGKVSGEEARNAQKNAAYLLHVESFSNDIIDSTRMSFSTKLIDYMMTGNPILAIGPGCINSIKVLREKKLAYVVDNTEEIKRMVYDIINGQIDADELLTNVRHFLSTERDIVKIQVDMRKRMETACKAEEQSFK